MNYKIVNIESSTKARASILIIYTGGTVGMVQDAEGSLVPFNFGKVGERLPELGALGLKLTVISFPTPIDSSNVNPEDWKTLAFIIEENYEQYDGFVVLHGTDTMAYSASAMSFILEGLNKPVIFTGAQIPIGSIRSDARENFITALEIASVKENGYSKVREVCIYFNNVLLRANRSQKTNSSTFSAFHSENYPFLAESGIDIEFNDSALRPYRETDLEIKDEFDTNVAILKIFPGINEHVITSYTGIPNLKGLILESYGSGNVLQTKWFLETIKSIVNSGVIVVNVSQCLGGTVNLGKYETSLELKKMGVVSGYDLTTEAAITKLMWLLGQNLTKEEVEERFQLTHVGEMTVGNTYKL